MVHNVQSVLIIVNLAQLLLVQNVQMAFILKIQHAHNANPNVPLVLEKQLVLNVH